jgi:hypothetical protein
MRSGVDAGFSDRLLRDDEVETLLDLLEEVAEERRWIATEAPRPKHRFLASSKAGEFESCAAITGGRTAGSGTRS